MAWKLAPKLAVIFRHLVRGGSFLACWKLADVVSVPKRSAFSDVGDYSPISITPVLKKVFQKIVTAGEGRPFLRSSSSYSVFVSQGPRNMWCFAHSVLPLHVALDWGGGHGGKTFSVRLLSCI